MENKPKRILTLQEKFDEYKHWFTLSVDYYKAGEEYAELLDQEKAVFTIKRKFYAKKIKKMDNYIKKLLEEKTYETRSMDGFHAFCMEEKNKQN